MEKNALWFGSDNKMVQQLSNNYDSHRTLFIHYDGI